MYYLVGFMKNLRIIFATFLFLTLPAWAMQNQPSLGNRLALAASQGDLAAVSALITAGVDPNISVPIEEPTVEKEQATIRAGQSYLDRYIKNTRLMQPLAWAIEGEHKTVCKFLLDHGANPNHFSSDRNITALCYAAENSSDDPSLCLLLLRYGADINKRFTLAHAALKGNKKICEFLLGKGALNEETALCMAARYGQLHMCTFFLKRGVSVNARYENRTPLLYATEFAIHFGDWNAVAGRVMKLFKILIEAGADLNARSADLNARRNAGMTPLMIASTRWHFPAELLLEAGADPRIQTWDGFTALSFCAIRDDRLQAERDLLPLITHPIFNPIVADTQFALTRMRIFTALLTLNRMCRKMPKDLRKYIFRIDPELKRDTLYSGAFGIDVKFSPSVPLQTVRLMINSGKWNKDEAITKIKTHHYACITPVMANALGQIPYTSDDYEKRRALLNCDSEVIEQTYGATIERNIKRRLKMRSLQEFAHDATQTSPAYLMPDLCTLQ